MPPSGGGTTEVTKFRNAGETHDAVDGYVYGPNEFRACNSKYLFTTPYGCTVEFATALESTPVAMKYCCVDAYIPVTLDGPIKLYAP